MATEGDTFDHARALYTALRDVEPVPPPTDALPDLSLEAAYEIQRQLIELRLGDGERRVGRKVGLTSAAMQRQLGVDQPDYGVVLDSMVVPASADVDAGGLIAPRVEAEIAFWLERPLSGPEVTAADVLGATGQVAAALEIIDSRVEDWRITIADTIADNASSGLVILGDRVDVAGLDLKAEEAVITVGDRREAGKGAAVLGDPAEAVAWLARTLHPFGEGLEAGEFVIPGAVHAAIPFSPGDVIRATYSSLGDLEVTIR